MPKIEMYSPSFCPFCWGAQRLLKSKSVDFTIYPVDGDPQRRKEMMDRGGGYTVPQIFVDDRPLGGFDEISALDMDGDLDRLLGIDGGLPDDRGFRKDD